MVLVLANSPSSGEYEALAALYLAGAHDGRKVPASRLHRHFPTRVPPADIATVLNGISGTYVAKSGSTYGLTPAGVQRARAHKPRRYLTVT